MEQEGILNTTEQPFTRPHTPGLDADAQQTFDQPISPPQPNEFMQCCPHKPDPYCQFKADDQRRRALNFRSGCQAVVAVALAANPEAALQWLRALLGQ